MADQSEEQGQPVVQSAHLLSSALEALALPPMA